jgi:hypothetical protein
VALVTAGQHPLQLDKPPGHSSAPSNVSAVPLPGALWLFGSAVVAFLGFSMRRKI